ncbi:hypothetical protein CPC08DRAFT_51664 [Agrocybe pediades]|nr:hypothetical protein CPC08DRAFT_51664 [Agrocybe pediades]
MVTSISWKRSSSSYSAVHPIIIGLATTFTWSNLAVHYKDAYFTYILAFDVEIKFAIPACALPRIMSSLMQVFVDDSDPSIVYAGGPWVAQTGIPTAPQGLTSPGRTPWYGTLHKAVGDGNLSYTFHGTSISAYFLGNEAVIQTCAIDGKEQRVQTLFGQIICSNNVTLSDAQHKLTISTSSIDPIKGPITASFDGLYFTPSADTLTQAKAGGTSVDTVNMTATQSGPPTLSAPGDTFEFMFNGARNSIVQTLRLPDPRLFHFP